MLLSGVNQTLSLRRALERSQEILRRHVVSDVCASESEILALAAFRQVLGFEVPKIEFYSKINDVIPPDVLELLFKWSELRAGGHILQHLTGVQVFMDHEYQVSSDVLVPRPETELLLRTMTDDFGHLHFQPKLGLEIGLGSGILSIELLKFYPDLKMLASEFSDSAIEIAKKNANQILGSELTSLRILRSQSPQEVWEPFELAQPFLTEPECRAEQKADFLVSNPPYLSDLDPIDLDVLNHEPRLALFPFADSKSDPLYFYRKIAEKASGFLQAEGFAYVEIPHQRAEEIEKLFSRQDHWEVKVFSDLNNQNRILRARKKLKPREPSSWTK